MSTVLRGYERREGQFVIEKTGEVKQYDNYLLHFTSDDREEVTGLFCGSVKCKTGQFQLVGANTLEECINQEVMFVMDMTESTPTVGAIVLVPSSGGGKT